MRILLINPPQVFFPGSKSFYAGVPLGLLYIAAALDRKGYQVQILDAATDELQERRVGDTVEYGMPWQNIERAIVRAKADIVGIGNPFTAQLDSALKIAALVKDINVRTPTVMGGPHCSVEPAQLLEKAKDVDIAVIGEGEETILDLVKAYQGLIDIEDVGGIAYRRRDEVKLSQPRQFIKNLDDLPFPAYHLIDIEKYLSPRRNFHYRYSLSKREISVITSRGCPFQCIFCSIHLHMGRQWRAHSSQYVIRHIEHLVKTYGIEHIHFEDDNLTLHAGRFEDLLNGVINNKIRFTWDTPNGVRADTLRRDLLQKMKATGCARLAIGIESGDQSVLDNVIRKQLKLENVITTSAHCRDLDIPLSAFYVIGFPGEKLENMKRTIEFALKLKREYGVSMSLLIATPLYGTELHRICKDKGYTTKELTPRALSEATNPLGTSLIRTEDFAPEQIKKLARTAMRNHNRLLILEFCRTPLKSVQKVIKKPRQIFQAIKMLIR